ncbi:Uncharacterised protein [uncultured archaeon]|nr:Uncharacterised protein [uncultured archaeon]
MTAFIENIRKMMGWCPSVNSWTYKPEQPFYYANHPISPGGKSVQIRPIQSCNVVFPANTAIMTFFFVAGFSILANFSRHMDYSVLFVAVVTLYAFYYFISLKSFQAGIRVDKNGVYYNSFRLRQFTLNYSDIRSIKSFKWELKKYSMKTKVILLGILFAAFIIFVIMQEWRVILLATPALPLYLLLKRKEERHHHGLDTQLYIESKTKKWYEISPYYSIITDEKTASEISDIIELHIGGRDSIRGVFP